MLFVLAVFASFISSISATCGTHCGGCTATCVNNPAYTCTDCGFAPCLDVDKMCWSCAGSDLNCYPYDCGATCSTSPCSTVEALANSVTKLNASTFIADEKKTAPAMKEQMGQLITSKGARTSAQAMMTKTQPATVNDYFCDGGYCAGTGTCCSGHAKPCCGYEYASCCTDSDTCCPSGYTCVTGGCLTADSTTKLDKKFLMAMQPTK